MFQDLPRLERSVSADNTRDIAQRGDTGLFSVRPWKEDDIDEHRLGITKSVNAARDIYVQRFGVAEINECHVQNQVAITFARIQNVPMRTVM